MAQGKYSGGEKFTVMYCKVRKNSLQGPESKIRIKLIIAMKVLFLAIFHLEPGKMIPFVPQPKYKEYLN